MQPTYNDGDDVDGNEDFRPNRNFCSNSEGFGLGLAHLHDRCRSFLNLGVDRQGIGLAHFHTGNVLELYADFLHDGAIENLRPEGFSLRLEVVEKGLALRPAQRSQGFPLLAQRCMWKSAGVMARRKIVSTYRSQSYWLP